MAEVLGDETAVTCFSSPARFAARPMMSAKIVSWSRPPWSPQKTGSVGSG
ncbi:MAG TPA: hypothetical protein VFA44_15085 [Gaiellaceae bacterium]|nr:hypothetical protein [Gaiellaceae bacterium]